MDLYTHNYLQNESLIKYDFRLMLLKIKLIIVHQMNYLKDQHE